MQTGLRASSTAPAGKAVGVGVPLERVEARAAGRRGPGRPPPRPSARPGTSRSPARARASPARGRRGRAAARRGRRRASAGRGRAAAGGRASPRAATDGARPGRRASRRRRPSPRRRSRAGRGIGVPHARLHSSSECPRSRATSPKTPERQSSPWITPSTSIDVRVDEERDPAAPLPATSRLLDPDLDDLARATVNGRDRRADARAEARRAGRDGRAARRAEPARRPPRCRRCSEYEPFFSFAVKT